MQKWLFNDNIILIYQHSIYPTSGDDGVEPADDDVKLC